jgi:hypothetical protein
MPESISDPVFVLLFGIGCGVAIFFFAIRDIYPTILLATFVMIFLWASSLDPVYLHVPNLSVYVSAAITVGVLAGIHRHFSRHFTTISVPAQ